MSTIQTTCTAILLTGIQRTQHPQLGEVRALLPLVDKPALQLAVESLVRLGCETLHVFLGDAPAQIREFLGSGERWGVNITCHYLDDDIPLAANLKRLGLEPGASCWLGNAETTPLEFMAPQAGQFEAPETVFVYREYTHLQWTGWAHVSTRFLHTLNCATEWSSLASRLISEAELNHQHLDTPYDVRTDPACLASNIRRLEQLCEQQNKEILISRGARIHPSARIVGPVFIGPQARIEAEAEIGQNTIIGGESIIDEACEIRDSLIMPGTYVGKELFLEAAVVAPGTFASIRNATLVSHVDPHLLAASNPSNNRRVDRQRLSASLLRVSLYPLYWLARHSGGKGETEKSPALQVYRIRPDTPRPSNELITLPIVATAVYSPPHGGTGWRQHFIHTFYPGLKAVCTTDIALFGLEIRHVEDIRSLPNHWKSLYRTHPCGLLNGTMLHLPEKLDSTVQYSCDACAAAGLSGLTKLRILVNYLSKVFCDCLCKRNQTPATSH